MQDHDELIAELDQVLSAPTVPPADQQARLGAALKTWVAEARTFEDSAVGVFIEKERAFLRRQYSSLGSGAEVEENRRYLQAKQEWETAAAVLDTAREDLQAALLRRTAAVRYVELAGKRSLVDQAKAALGTAASCFGAR